MLSLDSCFLCLMKYYPPEHISAISGETEDWKRVANLCEPLARRLYLELSYSDRSAFPITNDRSRNGSEKLKSPPEGLLRRSEQSCDGGQTTIRRQSIVKRKPSCSSGLLTNMSDTTYWSRAYLPRTQSQRVPSEALMSHTTCSGPTVRKVQWISNSDRAQVQTFEYGSE
jgi:hypothetical protein